MCTCTWCTFRIKTSPHGYYFHRDLTNYCVMRIWAPIMFCSSCWHAACTMTWGGAWAGSNARLSHSPNSRRSAKTVTSSHMPKMQCMDYSLTRMHWTSRYPQSIFRPASNTSNDPKWSQAVSVLYPTNSSPTTWLGLCNSLWQFSKHHWLQVWLWVVYRLCL